MVTSFRPRSPLVKDDSVLTTVRAVSNLSQLYGGYTEYRLENAEERIRTQLKKLRERKKTGKKFDTAGVKLFLEEQRTFFDATLTQLVDDDKVIPGYTDSSHLLAEDLRERDIRKTKFYIGDESRS